MEIALNRVDRAVLVLADVNDPRIFAIRQHLRDYCQQLIFTAQVSEIISLINTYHAELILLDLHLCGVALIKQLRGLSSINLKTPVIALTNNSDREQKKNIIAAGFDDCLIKSVNLNQLAELLEVWQVSQNVPNELSYVTSMLSKTYGNKKLALTIFQKLLMELPEQVSSIKEALEIKQYELARQVVHKLNGSASLCGFVDMQRSAQTLENSLLNQNYSKTHKSFSTLQQDILNFTKQEKAILAYFGQ